MMASYAVSELEAIADVDGHLWEARRIREAVMIKRADVWKGGKAGEVWSHENGFHGGSRCNGMGKCERVYLMRPMFPFAGRV
jgi:hypothetical protein